MPWEREQSANHENYIWTFQKLLRLFGGDGNDESQSWCKLMYINLWLYVLQGIVPGHEPPHVRVEDLEVSSSAWPGCWLITHHCQAKTLGVSLLLEGGGSPKYTSKNEASCWFSKMVSLTKCVYFKPIFLGEKEQRSDPNWTKNHGSVWREANQTMIMGRNL